MAVFAVTSKLKLALKKRYIRIITGYILIAEIKRLKQLSRDGIKKKELFFSTYYIDFPEDMEIGILNGFSK